MLESAARPPLMVLRRCFTICASRELSGAADWAGQSLVGPIPSATAGPARVSPGGRGGDGYDCCG